MPFGLRVNPNLNLTTSSPVNITTGTDLNGDTNFNDRPAFATVAADPTRGVFATRWGVFNADPIHNPQYGSVIIPRNYGYGYGRFDISGRLTRSWSFGERPGSRPAANAQGNGPGGGNFGGGGGGNFGGGGGGGDRGWRRWR